jgi:hypothetical protein
VYPVFWKLSRIKEWHGHQSCLSGSGYCRYKDYNSEKLALGLITGEDNFVPQKLSAIEERRREQNYLFREEITQTKVKPRKVSWF